MQSEVDFPELAGMVGGQIRIHDNPPLIFHPEEAHDADFRSLDRGEHWPHIGQTLADDRRVLLDRYHVVDAAMKVVGIGSVGTRCAIVLLMSVANEPLFLQFKEARRSVLEPYAGKSPYAHHGQRVVIGQRLMQPATDIFLGWITTQRGRHGYVRQLRDAKIKPLLETFDAEMMTIFGQACGWTSGAGPRQGGRRADDQRLSRIKGGIRRIHGRFRDRVCRSGRARSRRAQSRCAGGEDRSPS